jgi:GNAT superfamily N-acetyltransferase
METKIIKIKTKEWSRFQPFLAGGPCCNNAFPSASVYGLLTGESIDSLASMVWYTNPFYHTSFRSTLLPELSGIEQKEILPFLNKNVRVLARIGTLPEFRKKGYAFRLVEKTLPLLNVKYIECLTAHEDVRCLLTKLGFKKVSENRNKTVDYWLITL